MKKSRSKLGRAAAGSTRNQRRKDEYAKKAALEQAARRQNGIVGKRAKVAERKLVGTAIHRIPCGNIACRKCFTRTVGVGIYPNYGEFTPGPGRVISGVRYRTPQEAALDGAFKGSITKRTTW